MQAPYILSPTNLVGRGSRQRVSGRSPNQASQLEILQHQRTQQIFGGGIWIFLQYCV